MYYVDVLETKNYLVQNPLSDNHPLYDANKTYNKGDIVNHNDYIYMCLADDTLGKTPGESVEWIFWNYVLNIASIYKYPANTIACFDYYTQTQSILGENKKFIFENNLFDYIGAYNVDNANSVIVTIRDKDSGEAVFSQELSMQEIMYYDWYLWSIDKQPKYKHNFSLKLPIIPNSFVELEFIGESISIGFIGLGQTNYLGCTLQNITKRIKSAKQFKRDENSGTMYLDNRRVGGYSEISANIFIKNYLEVDSTLNTLNKIKNQPVVFIVDDREDASIRKNNYTIFGLFEDIENTLTNVSDSYTITIKSID